MSDNDSAFTKPAADVLEALHVDPEHGLSTEEAHTRREQFGLNRIETGARSGTWEILLNQLKSVVIMLLIAAGALAAVMGEIPELIAVILVVVVNTSLGFFTELKAVRTMDALRELGQSRARVLRDGTEQDINATEVVPGDILMLDVGDFLSADARVLSTERLSVDESSLTGESVPVSKAPDAVDDPETPLAERSSMVYKGTTVTDGYAHAVVTATGMHTELGSIASKTRDADAGVAPLQKRMNELGNRLAWITILLALAVAGLGLWSGKDIREVVETSIALGVAAIPEGLPIVATIALAHGMWLMAQHKVVMNRLTAVETLGSTRIIFTDKTGTLTQNSMEVRRVVTRDGQEHELTEDATLPDTAQTVVELGVLCNNADLDDGTGDPMESALLRAGQQLSKSRDELIEAQPEEREVDFDRETMMMATVHRQSDGQFRYAIKGAPEAVLHACNDIDNVDSWTDRANDLAGQGLRVLGFAEKHGGSADEEPYEGLSFRGFVGMEDPVREDVKEPLSICRDAGIRVIMVTGDQPATARAIARELNLLQDADGNELEVHTGRDIQNASREELEQMVRRTAVFARVSPEQKLDLVGLFQDSAETVAMTGDGVNDSPALKQADIGIAMGKRGTDAAREAAEMILGDDAFSSIVRAVRRGRVIYSNIRKSIMFMLCTNVSEIFAVGVGAVSFLGIPLTAMQILFLNMLTDVFPALALGIGKGTRSVMDAPPRPPDEPVLTRTHWLTIGAWAFIVGSVVLATTWVASGPMGLDAEASTTLSFLTLGFAKLWFVFNLRDRKTTLWSNTVVRNPWVWAAVVFCAALLVAAVYIPLVSDVLPAAQPTTQGWILVLGMSAIPFVIGQIWIEVRSLSVGRRSA
ncbi:MAG: cation-translocating P-type ATPase [Spirochaetaceae bacterium]